MTLTTSSVKHTKAKQSSPGLLDDVIGPNQTTHVTRAVVSAGKGFERAGDGVGQHEDEGSHPGGGDDLGSVRLGLPHPGF